MTETLLPVPLTGVLAAAAAVPHGPEWGWYECQRLATPAEMAETGNHCAECGVLLTAKVGGGLVQGTVVGYRAHREAPWGWTGPLCRPCDVAHAVADGY